MQKTPDHKTSLTEQADLPVASQIVNGLTLCLAAEHRVQTATQNVSLVRSSS